MSRSLAGSGLLHAVVLGLLAALTAQPSRDASDGGKGQGSGLDVLAVRLEATAAAARPSRDAAPAAVAHARVARAQDAKPPAPIPSEKGSAVEPVPVGEAPVAAVSSAPSSGAGLARAAIAMPLPAAAPSLEKTGTSGAGATRGAADAGDATAFDVGPGRDGGSGEGTESGAGRGAGEGLATGVGNDLDAPPVPLHVAVPALPPGVDADDARGTRVRLLLDVSETGEVRRVNLVRSSGMAELDRAAVEAARKLRYLPATRGGRPVPATAEAEIAF